MGGNRLGIIGLGLMGREIASAILRWAHLAEEVPRPVITGICSPHDSSHEWFRNALDTILVDTTDYRELLGSEAVDMVYVAVPHNLHEEIYVAALDAGKDLFGEKPFGIDLGANKRIVSAIENHPKRFVRCSSQWPYFPPVQRIVTEIEHGAAGRIIELRAGFHHASDLDLSKPLNWKRQIAANGEYGCMGDLGFHVMYLPFRLGLLPATVSAVLSNIATERPGPEGKLLRCETWDNATILCEAEARGALAGANTAGSVRFPMTFETKRMMPGATNSWFIELYTMKRSYRYSTQDPRTLFFCDNSGRTQSWNRLDMGYQGAFKSISGGIFEFGFPDAMQQMLAAFMLERADFHDGARQSGPRLSGRFGTATPAETNLSHRVMTAALEAQRDRRTVDLDTIV